MRIWYDAYDTLSSIIWSYHSILIILKVLWYFDISSIVPAILVIIAWIYAHDTHWTIQKNHILICFFVFGFSYHSIFSLGLERIHQVTNAIRIANTGWRIRICIREYSDSLIHSRILLTECASEEEVLFGKYNVGYIIHIKTETPIKARRGSGFYEIFCIFANMRYLVTLFNFNLPCKKNLSWNFFFMS